MDNERQSIRSSVIGKVVSDKMDKTAVIETHEKIKHKRYTKYISRNSRYFAHDPQNVCKIGDLVRIQETRPRSKKKSWEVVEIVNTNK